MGIYLKGIKMPKGEEHPLWIAVHSDGTVEYNENKGDGWQMTTAVPVPPHGRLGDLDALCESKDILDDVGWPDAYLPISTIEAAPTIIPADPGEEKTT